MKNVISVAHHLLLPSNLTLTIMGFPKNASQQASARVVLMLDGCFDFLAPWEPLFSPCG